MRDLIAEDRVVRELERLSDNSLYVANNLRLLKQATSCNGIVALIDGIDLGQVHRGLEKCDFCLERLCGDEVRYYHRVVVISIMSKYGPLPLFFRYCRPTEVSINPLEVSAEKFKSDCELSCTKMLLVEVAERFGGKLPFNIVASDALMANAPFMNLVETLGSAGVFIFKQENRRLYRQAKADFTGQTLGFGVQEKYWDKDPSGRGRTFFSQWSSYVDNNREGENKNVKIFQTTRTETDGSQMTGMAITSDNRLITPELVEELRFAKWNNLENGVFNALTTQWKTLKHLFFHSPNAMQSMLFLQFMALITYQFYCFGNLTRGGRRFIGTVRDFFKQMIVTLFSIRGRQLLEIRCNSP